ncbi:hypothetical protein G7Y41_09390 [Schaalia sp. ZJ405]|uniref:Ig-like domain-containing protein n=1 Tax=Schaalia sp. ZJ405 TaxID=2709403 RepID=UPI0013EBEA87|nr:Ig-like domain-containing protein [Schaalia sp. ZJ405]QPK81228.1 hypothetical protein G7Y41_09390 [Schaalia sp. ZJ405]
MKIPALAQGKSTTVSLAGLTSAHEGTFPLGDLKLTYDTATANNGGYVNGSDSGNIVQTYEAALAFVESPRWDDSSSTPDKSVTIPNTGGTVKDGTTIEVEGPGTATLNEDGSITVTPKDNAKPGDTIVVTVKDGNGEVLDTLTVTVDQPEKVSAGKPEKSSSGKKGKLAKTGAAVGGIAVIAMASMAAGTAIMRRRHDA